MVFIGTALMVAFLGLFALFLVLYDRRNWSRSHQEQQTWKRTVLPCMLFTLEACVLSLVAVCLVFAIEELGLTELPTKGFLGVFLGYMILIAPYLLVTTSFLFVLVGSLAFLWRKKRSKPDRENKGDATH
jgi:heme/copper-type cytochrome/quinol oxidase subunit 2